MTMMTSTSKQRCTALTKAGRPCQAWAVHGTDPPRCAAHGGVEPAGDEDEQDPEEALEQEIYAVRRLLWMLLAHLDEDPELGVQELARIAPLMLNTTRTVAQLLRDQRALSGETAEGITGAIGQALDELAVEWGFRS